STSDPAGAPFVQHGHDGFSWKRSACHRHRRPPGDGPEGRVGILVQSGGSCAVGIRILARCGLGDFRLCVRRRSRVRLVRASCLGESSPAAAGGGRAALDRKSTRLHSTTLFRSRVTGIGDRLATDRRAAWEYWYSRVAPARWGSAFWHAVAWAIFGSAYVGAVVFVSSGLHASASQVLLVLAAGARL